MAQACAGYPSTVLRTVPLPELARGGSKNMTAEPARPLFKSGPGPAGAPRGAQRKSRRGMARAGCSIFSSYNSAA